MSDHKNRVKKLERRIMPGRPILIVEETEGRIYLDGEETTWTEIQERHNPAIILVDNIPRDNSPQS